MATIDELCCFLGVLSGTTLNLLRPQNRRPGTTSSLKKQQLKVQKVKKKRILRHE